MKLLKALVRAAAHPATSVATGAVALPLGMDMLAHPDKVKTFGVDTIKQLVNGEMTAPRVMNMLLNAGIGAGAGGVIHSGVSGLFAKDPNAVTKIFGGVSGAALAPAKDILLNSQSLPREISDVIAHAKEKSDEAVAIARNTADAANSAVDAAKSTVGKAGLLMGLLGAGALGLGGLAVAKYLTRKDPRADMGKIKLKLPGSRKDPNTAAEVELPIDMPGMSPALIEGLNRGVRLQARKNVRANSFKRDSVTGKLIPYEEWKEKQKAQMAEMQEYAPTSTAAYQVSEFPKQASAIPAPQVSRAKLLKALGVGAGGTLGIFGGGAAGAMLANAMGGNEMASLLAGIAGMGVGGLGGALLGSQLGDEGDDSQIALQAQEGANVANSFANTGIAPRGYAAVPNQEDLRDEWEEDDDLVDKYASMGPPPPQPPPPSAQARRPVGETIPPSAGIMPPAANTGAPPLNTQASVRRVLHMVDNLRRKSDASTKQASYDIEYYPLSGGHTKSASSVAGRMEVMGIMDKIYKEDPSYWPYGLDISGHEGVYLIRDKMTKQAAGFVGWQVQNNNGRRIGSYSIGILPEYRQKGFAKEAVAKILREKAAGVDEVCSFVMPHNSRSKALASALGVPVREEF